MTPRSNLLRDVDLEVFASTAAFIKGRLAERQTVDWALALDERETAKRLAVLSLLTTPTSSSLSEPWRSAWRLIEESWRDGLVQPNSFERFDLATRLYQGERTGALIYSLTELVKPRVRVAPFGNLSFVNGRSIRVPKVFHDLMEVDLTSGDLILPTDLDIGKVADAPFLVELAHSLEAAVTRGIDVAKRLFGNEWLAQWRLGGLRRVYYVESGQNSPYEDDPDRFHTGIAPSVKLLHSTIQQLREVDLQASLMLIRHWKAQDSPIHYRLWCSFARDPEVAESTEVERALAHADDRKFWDLHAFPEFAELRAVRFSSLASTERHRIENRLRKGPPISHWPKTSKSAEVEEARRYWAVRELRRIQIAEGGLSSEQGSWVETQLQTFNDLKAMRREEGFLESSEALPLASSSDLRFDFLSGKERLAALESALSSGRSHWADDAARSAAAWIQSGDNVNAVLADFLATGGGFAYSSVWDQFAWRHPNTVTDPETGDFADGKTVLKLVATMPHSTAESALLGLTYWLEATTKWFKPRTSIAAAWQHLWPLSVSRTNAVKPGGSEETISAVEQGDNPPRHRVSTLSIARLAG